MRVNLELSRSVVTLKTKSAWTSTTIEKTSSARYKTFILDRSRGVKILKNIDSAKKIRVKGKLAQGRWKQIRFSRNGHVVAVFQVRLSSL